MKKFVFVLGLCFMFGTTAMADVCYDINDKIATNAADIIQTQEEIYEYCSICHDAKPEMISVKNIQKGNPIRVNGIALDLAHTYYKKDNKFINLGVAAECIKAGEYDIPAELESFDTHMKEKNKINDLKEKFIECSNKFEAEEKKCSEIWGTKCYNHVMRAHENVRRCYKQIAVDLFNKFYGISEKEAEIKYDNFQKFIYEQYLFIYTESNYCKKNNCGVSLYLYSEYATTQELRNYISKIITYISGQ